MAKREKELRMQTLTLVLSDGREIHTTVPAFWDGTGEAPSVAEVRIGPSRPLPTGCEWGNVFEDKEGRV